jgi:transposase
MSTSFLYHVFGARTYDPLKTEYREGAVYLHLIKKDRFRRCVACHSDRVTREGCTAVTLHSLPLGRKKSFLVLHLHRLRCHRCGALRQESRDVAPARKRYTSALARLVLELCEQMTLLAVARYVGLDWETVKDILTSELRRRVKRRRLSRVRTLALDEIAVRKGHRYLTVVVDLDSGCVLFVVPGRDHLALQPVFARLRAARAKLVAIAVDMSAAYLKAIQLYAPKDVTVVHDPFHLVAAMNEVLDQIRRTEQNRLEQQGKQVLKGGRYLLLGARERVHQQPRQRSRLGALLEANQTLHKVYLLKEDLRQLWSQKDKKAATLFLFSWLVEAFSLAAEQNLPPLHRLASTLLSAWPRLVSWYDYPVSTGPLEGLNNKIKVLKRMAYGFRDQDFFALRILCLHQTRFQLTGA